MEIESSSSFDKATTQELKILYRDINFGSELEGRKVSVVHAYCFVKDAFLIVYAAGKGYWTPPGGTVEAGESLEEAVMREVHEETNMKVIKQALLGYQDVFLPNEIETQARSVCIVEPYGNFISDPDGDITEIKPINPAEYKKYFDWGIIGDHLMKRALELKTILEQ
jgi:8-oxo-dGTP diphosphatase